MKVYSGEDIRTVAVTGHGDTGKTSLVTACLFTAGLTDRLGRVDDGQSVTDFDEEEISRKVSIWSALAHAEWAGGKVKINFIDTPGYNLFINDTKAAMVAAKYGQGSVVLIGFRPQHRAQTHGTFKLVFNTLMR